MKAMVLAAGLGTRLRPLTDDRPKALVELAGHSLLEIVLARLRSFGVDEAVINAHHFAEMLIGYLTANRNFGMRIQVSCEDVLLDTGGGLKRAAPILIDSAASLKDPIVVHNVDVISSIDLDRMVRFHIEHDALATLAVQDRESSRCLLFDAQGLLCGRRAGWDSAVEWARPAEAPTFLAFSGIHVVSPRLFAGLIEEGAFSIVSAYLRLAAQGEKILAYRADGCYWRDLGQPESLRLAEKDLASGRFSLG